jgi:cysteine dioxygenase
MSASPRGVEAELDSGSAPIAGLDTLSTVIDSIFKTSDNWIDRRAAIHSALNRTVVTPSELSTFALFDPRLPYTRNLVATDNTHYTLLILCWNVDKESPIHDHPCDGCFIKALQGKIRESRYVKDASPESDQLVLFQETIVHSGAVTYMDDFVGYHKVGCAGTEPAITLHLYTPPYHSCKVWASPERFSSWSEGKVTFYSKHGQPMN